MHIPAPSPFFSVCCVPDTRAVRRRCDVERVAAFCCAAAPTPTAVVVAAAAAAADAAVVVFGNFASDESAESTLSPMGEVGVVGVDRPLLLLSADAKGFSIDVVVIVIDGVGGVVGVETAPGFGPRWTPIIAIIRGGGPP